MAQLNEGLTRAENALLSDEEKMIKLVSREKEETCNIMPNGDKLQPKSTREHLLSIYGYITGLKKDVKHMHEGIHDLGGKI